MKIVKRGCMLLSAMALVSLSTAACNDEKVAGDDNNKKEEQKKDDSKKDQCVPTAINCSDKIDNNCDGKIDCEDAACADDPVCKSNPDDECKDKNEICNDKIDNNCDGAVDCEDMDCADDPACKSGPVDLCEGNKCANEGKECNPADGKCYGGEDDKCQDKVCEDDNTVCDMKSGDCVCDNDFIDEGNGCIHEKMVPCGTPADKLPANAEYVTVDDNGKAITVKVTYSSSYESWNSPSRCRWECKPGTTQVNGSCKLNEEGSKLKPDGTCTDDSNGKHYHAVDGVCIRNVPFDSGIAKVLEDVEGFVGEPVTIRGTFDGMLCAKEKRDGQCPGVKAQLCYEKVAGAAKSFDDFTCIDAVYEKDNENSSNKDDIYKASVTFNTAGKYAVLYRWQGNGVDWYMSDLGGIRKSWEQYNSKNTKADATITESVVIDGLSYSQNFDSLGVKQGSWVDNNTLPGWFVTSWSKTGTTWVSLTTYGSSAGEKGTDGFLSLGSRNDGDRALGGRSTNAAQQTYYLVLKNESNKALSKITVSYKGEQWSTGTNTAADMQGILRVSYAVLTAMPSNMNSFREGDAGEYSNAYKGTIELDDLDFVAPQGGTKDVTALDGNAAANSELVSASFNADVPVGSYILLKWFDPRENGTNSALGIDDVTVIGE